MNLSKSSVGTGMAPVALLGDIKALIEASRQRAALAVNAELTLLFWHIGQRIHTEVLAGQRAGYGEEILPSLAEQLVHDYGRSFADKNLRRMVQFAATYPDEPIVVTLSRQLSWSHFLALPGHHRLEAGRPDLCRRRVDARASQLCWSVEPIPMKIRPWV